MALRVWRQDQPPKPAGAPIWHKADRGDRYQSLLSLYRTENGLELKVECEGRGVFEYTPNGVGIAWEYGGTGPAHYFQTLGLSLWLELQGVPCIHANALALADRAIGIIAPSRTGKTTLTAALLDAGLQMMTDDMLALHRDGSEWRAYPGWPQFRMWPDIAKKYTALPLENLERVHKRFEKRIVDLEENGQLEFCSGSRPLTQLLLLERRESSAGTIEIESIPPGEALLHLLQNSMLADAYKALSIEQERMKALATLLSGISLKRVRYPSGLHHLPRVCEHIMATVEKGD